MSWWIIETRCEQRETRLFLTEEGRMGQWRAWSFPEASQLSNRQDTKVAKTNKFDVFACGETTSGKLGVLGVLAVKNAAYVVLQEKTMQWRVRVKRTGAVMGWRRKTK
ncbi:MAG: hypothetical protein ACOYOU_14650 [Kiritimatiellia bacterium]